MASASWILVCLVVVAIEARTHSGSVERQGIDCNQYHLLLLSYCSIQIIVLPRSRHMFTVFLVVYIVYLVFPTLVI